MERTAQAVQTDHPTSHRRIKTGLIGCGNIGPAHAEALAALPRSEFHACCDTDAARAHALARRFDVPHACHSLDDLLASGVEALMVCTPHPSHEAIVTRAAEAGVHVLCEKPISVHLDEADRMIAAAERAGITFGVVFMRRFWPAAQRARKAIDAGSIGWPTLGICQSLLWRPERYFTADAWRGKWETEGGGVLMNQAVHMVDMLQWLMSSPVVEVYGKYAQLAHGDYLEVEDHAVATLVFASGALGIIQAATSIEPDFGYRVTVHGSNGATIGILERPEGSQGINDIWTLPDSGDERLQWEQEERDRPGFPGFHLLQIEDFLDAIIEGRQPAVTGVEARKSLAIIQAIYASSRTGLPVRFE
jgi:predicted dehydrogenase